MSSQDGGNGDQGTSSQEFDAELDLLNRYQEMVQIQINTLNGIDDKAAFAGRLIAIVIGLIVSALSVIVGTDRFSLTPDTGVVLLLLGASSIAFFISLVFAIITYLSSKFEYGPSAGLGDFIIDEAVSDRYYKEILLRGYGETIRRNRRVVVNNARRFEQCLAHLLVGLIFLFATGVALIPSGRLVDVLIAGGATLSALKLRKYILEEEYLTLDRRQPDDE